MHETYGTILRKAREDAGLSIEEVSVKLAALGYKVSPKTLYGYENDVSSPKISLFMTMCKLYNVRDVYATFHMRDGYENPSLVLTTRERQVILAYRAKPSRREAVDLLLELPPLAESKQA